MQKDVLDQAQHPDLRSYVVWVPMVRGLERDVPAATAEVPDSRARHYWDGEGRLMAGYRERLQIAEPAWDVYLLFGPEARWDDELPPAPLYWAHQLGSAGKPRVAGPYLDLQTFLDRTLEALGVRS